MLLIEDKKQKLFLCTSANWQSIVQAENCDEAASKAVQEILDEMDEKFSIGVAVAVTEMQIKKKNTLLIFAPKVLADIGLHAMSSNLLAMIEEEKKDEN